MIEIAVIRSITPSGTGNQSYTKSGFGTPDAALIFGFKSTSDDSTAAHDIMCGGATDGTREWVVRGKALDNVGTTYCKDGCSNSDCYAMYSTGNNTNVDIEANFNAWVTDGIQLNFTAANYQAGIMIVLIKADNVYCGWEDVSSGSPKDVTAPGFEPNYVFSWVNLYNGLSGDSNNLRNIFGMCANTGAAVTQGCIRQVHDDGSANGSVQGNLSNDSVYGSVYNTGSEAVLSGFDSNGFTITFTNNTATYFRYLAIGDADNGAGKVDDIVAPGSTGNQAYTGFGNKPKYAFIITSEFDDINVQDSDSTRNVMGIAVIDKDNDSFFTTYDEDGAATTVTACRSGSGIKSFDRTSESGYDHAAVLNSMDSDGFTLNYTTAAQSVYWIAMTIGPDSELSIAPTGIASTEAFGSPSIGMGITPSSIESTEAFGSPTVIPDQFITTPTGIASTEAFGSPSIGLEISTIGIASEESFGNPILNLKIYISSIISAESFGTPTVNLNISLTGRGISSEEVVGTPSLVYNQFVEPNGIASAEVFGNPQINMEITGAGGISSLEAWGLLSLILGPAYVQPNGIATEEAFGSPSLSTGNVNISPASIPSGEAFGSPSIGRQLFVNSIPSLEAFGNPTVTRGTVVVSPNSIASSESFGNPSVVVGTVYITPIGIVSQEVLGTPTIVPGPVTIQANSILSSEAFGSPTVDPDTTYISSNSIGSEEAFGNPTISVGNVNVSPNGISSGESFGFPYVTVSGVQISPLSVSSTEAFGSPSIVPGPVSVNPNSIGSTEVFGIPMVIPGGVVVSLTGIASQESFGSVNIGMSIIVQAIVSGESFGSPTVTVGGVDVSPDGISSEEAFGSPIVRQVLVLDFTGTGIASAEAFGNPTVSVIVRNEFMTMMESDLQDVFFNETEFAETAVYEFKNGSTISLPVIFDSETVMVDPDTGAQVISRNPMVQAQTSDFIYHPDKGDKMVIRGVRYQVVTHEPDGTGVSILHLHHERTV